MKITKSADCGNSPKNLLVQEICIAYVNHDSKFFERYIEDDAITRNIVHERTAEKSNDSKIREVRIIHPISHGKSGAVEYIVFYKNKNVKQFCLFIEFDSAAAKKIKRLKRYELKKG